MKSVAYKFYVKYTGAQKISAMFPKSKKLQNKLLFSTKGGVFGPQGPRTPAL